MTLAILLAFLIGILSAYRPMIAIQSTQETYFNYLPLTNCYPPNLNATQGGISYQQLDPARVLDIIILADNVAFWEGVGGALGLLLNVGDLLINSNYTQIIYYNSSIPSSSPSRPLLLVSFENDGNIMLTKAVPLVQDGSVVPSIKGNITTNLTTSQLDYINDCRETGITPQLTFLGNFSFLVLCPNSSQMFSFDVQANTTCDYSLDSPAMTASSNPILMLPGPTTTSSVWNAALLMQSGDQVLFCMFTNSEVGCEGLTQERSWFSTVADRAWGFQAWDEEDIFLNLLTEDPYLSTLNFTGTVVSAYKQKETVYVESIQDDNNYLTVFDQGELVTNTQLMGRIIYYGNEKLLVQAPNETLYLASFTLPYFTVDNQNNKSNIQWQFECQGVTYSDNSTIFWSNYSFPSALVIPINDSTPTSTQGVYTYSISDSFEVIGPDFQMFIETNTSIDISLLTAPVFYLTYQVVSILQVNFLEQYRPKLLLYLINELGELHLFTSGSAYSQIIAIRPCGFTSVQKAFMANGQYYIYNYQGDLCVCSPKFKDCSLDNDSDSITAAQQIEQVSNTEGWEVGNETGKEYILISSELILQTDPNGTVTLLTTAGQSLYTIQSGCDYNATNTLFFQRQFFDDCILVFCKGDPYVSQYSLRSNQFIFNRQIPLYGFIVRENGTHFSGVNYVFLEVEGNPDSLPYNISQEMGECCVLRVDPTEFTVSAIVEIVQALEIVFLESLLNVDIAYYNSTTVMETDAYLKVYFYDTWISLSNPPMCNSTDTPCYPATYSYYLNFASLLYNFAASFPQKIVYNIQQAVLSPSDFPFSLDLQGSSPSYNTTMVFNFSWLCGPLIFFEVTVQEEGPFISTITTSKVVTFNKLLETETVILQVVDLAEQLPGSAFVNYIMVVQSNAVTIYQKYSASWMDEALTFSISLPDCLYYLYQITNDTSAQFASTCFNTYSQTPTLTLSFNSTNNLTISIGTMDEQTQLRSIQSFPQEGDLPFVVGIQEGPIKATSGSLMLCHKYCGSLQIKTSINFLIDYDATETTQGLLVVGLDVQSLSFWLDPPSPVQDQVIPADLILGYRSITQSYCDTVTIVQALTPLGLTLIISCPSQYHQVLVDFDQHTLVPVRRYLKYANCDAANRAKPVFQLQDEYLTIIVAQCPNSLQTVYTEEYETINSSSIIITTAYLQVYTPYGPLCGKDWSPIRILPLSVTEPSTENYLIYFYEGQPKLLYQQMSGFLVDAFLSQQPVTQYTLSQLTRFEYYPQVNLTINNSYYNLAFQVPTEPPPNIASITATYVILSIFVATNILTLLFLLCWLVFKHPAIRRRLSMINSSTNKTDETSEEQPAQSFPTSSRSSSIRVSRQQPARRVTEIELFQPRYT